MARQGNHWVPRISPRPFSCRGRSMTSPLNPSRRFCAARHSRRGNAVASASQRVRPPGYPNPPLAGVPFTSSVLVLGRGRHRAADAASQPQGDRHENDLRDLAPLCRRQLNEKADSCTDRQEAISNEVKCSASRAGLIEHGSQAAMPQAIGPNDGKTLASVQSGWKARSQFSAPIHSKTTGET